jgi:hypothetical protein
MEAYLIGCTIGKCHISCLNSLTQKLSLALFNFGLYLMKTLDSGFLVSFKHWHRLTKHNKILTAKGANIGITVQMPQ